MCTVQFGNNKCQKHEGGKRERVCTKIWRTSPDWGDWLAGRPHGWPAVPSWDGGHGHRAGWVWVKGRFFRVQGFWFRGLQ